MIRLLSVFALAASLLVACTHASDDGGDAPAKIVAPPGSASAVFSGGCFWCIQPPFDQAKGVLATYVGYTGGTMENPTYEDVSSGETGHRESIEVFYDPSKISYSQLIGVFWHNINPTQADGQFYDIGSQYTTAIYYGNDKEKQEAIASKEGVGESRQVQRPHRHKDPATREVLARGGASPGVQPQGARALPGLSYRLRAG